MKRFWSGALLFGLAACSAFAPPRTAVVTAPPATLLLDDAEPGVPVPPHDLLEGEGTTRLKIGTIQPEGDIEAMDTGAYVEAVFAQELVKLLAIEASIGYFDTSGEIAGVSADLWGVPLFVNARLQVPVLVFSAYGGAGIGGVYVDAEVGGVGDTDFLGAWDAFLGLEFGLSGWGVGAEVKYLQTEESSGGYAVEGLTTVLFASLAF
jgi:opacity protein-like surface antigen